MTSLNQKRWSGSCILSLLLVQHYVAAKTRQSYCFRLAYLAQLYLFLYLVLVDHFHKESVERVDYNGSRSFMTSYIQAKFDETEGLFAVMLVTDFAFKGVSGSKSRYNRSLSVFFI